MVARNDNFMLVRQSCKVPIEFFQRLQTAMRTERDITRMTKNVARRKRDLIELRVRV